MFIQRIENVADHAKNIAQSVISLGKEECPKDLLNLALKTGNHVHRIYATAAEAMLIGDDKAANHVINEIDHFVPMRQQAEELMEQHLVKLCQEMLPELSPDSCALFGPHQKAMFCLESIFEAFGKILEHSCAIAEIAIDRALEHDSRWPASEPTKATKKKKKKSAKTAA
jgi:hypothetical protein